jgi:hypothetical protein
VKLETEGFSVGRYYWYTLTGSNDNGEFSRKVLVNGMGPSGIAGGPLNYESIRANAAIGQGNVTIEVPARSAVYILLEKGEITSVTDIDPSDKLVKLYPNPATNGRFFLDIREGNSNNKVSVQVFAAGGQLLKQVVKFNARLISFDDPLPRGTYRVAVQLGKGITVKSLIVQ